MMMKGKREKKKIVRIVRFRNRRASCIYGRPTRRKKKEKKSICYTFRRFPTTCK